VLFGVPNEQLVEQWRDGRSQNAWNVREVFDSDHDWCQIVETYLVDHAFQEAWLCQIVLEDYARQF
jgi:hypothetical protein